MTAPPLSHRDLSGAAIAMAVWTFGQAAIVAAYAAGLRLAGGYPTPPEATADLGLAIAQLALAVCFGPVLFADAGQCIRTAAIGLTWSTLAALLAGRSIGQTVELLAVTVAWCVAIAAWRGRPPAMLVLTFLTLAGPVLFYVSREYGPQPQQLGSWPTLLSPPLGVAATRLHESRFWTLLPPLLSALSTILIRFSIRRPVRDTSEN